MKCQMSLVVAVVVSVIVASEALAGYRYKAGAEKTQTTVIGRVVERGALSSGGRLIGYVDSRGQLVSNNKQSNDVGAGVDANVRNVKGLSKTELRTVLNSEVYNNADRSFEESCKVADGVGKEIQEIWYQDRNGYLRHERVDDGNGTSSEVGADNNKISQITKNGGKLLALVHNHPVGEQKMNCGAWPSKMDANNLAVIDQYIVDCTHDAQRKVIHFSKDDGKIYSVGSNGSEEEWTFEEYKEEYGERPVANGSFICPVEGDGGHTAYVPKADGKTISVDDLKKMNLDDANGDWCQCANPGCVNTFKVVNGKHEGYLTFVCSHCKKVNVGFAREALKYEGIIKGEGGTPQWFGPNAEANAKAAGNVK